MQSSVALHHNFSFDEPMPKHEESQNPLRERETLLNFTVSFSSWFERGILGLPMDVDKVGRLVWVQRKNGKWWPGRVASLKEISSSDHSSSASTSKTPIMLLGRKNGSVEWHKLENSRRIKSFRCGDFDNFVRKAESSRVSPCIKRVKYAHHDDAVLHALQLEKQEEGTRLKRPGKVQQAAISRAKRSRCVHLPLESLHHGGHLVIHSQAVKVSPSTSGIDDCYLQSGVAENTSSEVETSDFSGRDIQDSEGIMQATGVKKQKVGENANIQNRNGTTTVITNGKNPMISRNRRDNVRDLSMVNAVCQEISSVWYASKSGKQSSLEVNKFYHSSCEGSHMEDSDGLSFGSMSTNQWSWMETMLMDVKVTVLVNHRREDVPLVSLVSRLNGKVIIGHPIEIEALDDTSEVFLVRKGKFHHRLENDESIMNQLVWRTSKRTSVCYISNVHSSPSKGEETEDTCKSSDGSSLRARKGSSTEKVLWKPQMKAGFTKNESRELFNAIGQKDGLRGQKGRVKQRVTCVPVNFILSNLLREIGRE